MSGAESYITVTLEIKWTCDVEIEEGERTAAAVTANQTT